MDYMTKQKILSWIAVLIWMTIIFISSHLPATSSSELSSGVTEFILNTFGEMISTVGIDINDLHTIVRKNAHFFAYMVLGVLTANALRMGGGLSYNRAFYALVICMMYAASDEFHQLFIPGRSGELRDVLIDSAGAIVGVGIVLGLNRIPRFKKYQAQSTPK